ncbi:MAG: peptidoglycan-associated lipoprotein [Deltaproteobacteria bacterium GWA2_55_10]|nr:MAG: peptidoglycan-associated lipoprotein [Deltaproteobacteria bacterium GWA2_55_10]
MNGIFVRILPVVFLGTALFVTGCQKRVSTEDLAGQADSTQAQSNVAGTEVVPEGGAVGEGGVVTAEDIKGNSDARLGGSYASLTPGGDELTKKAVEKGQLFTIYFEYDKYTIRDIDMENLTKNAKWLGLNGSIKVRIEGHADERGETEYNLALGDKRARSVMKYLQDMGIQVQRLDVVSYGEEKPAMDGQGEDAWSKNRRAEFVIIAN